VPLRNYSHTRPCPYCSVLYVIYVRHLIKYLHTERLKVVSHVGSSCITVLMGVFLCTMYILMSSFYACFSFVTATQCTGSLLFQLTDYQRLLCWVPKDLLCTYISDANQSFLLHTDWLAFLSFCLPRFTEWSGARGNITITAL